jgi:cyclopropane-fatty-acyl-phospholipid synthase
MAPFRFEIGLEQADIQVGGSRDWDLRVKDERLYRRIVRQGFAGFADAYVDGWWECNALDQLYDRLLRTEILHAFRWHPNLIARVWRDRLFNLQRRAAAARNAKDHYDRGNDLFQAMLDRRMTYSCAYWDGAKTLDAAQEAKLDLVCRKLELEPGMRVLDIGCGWGSFAGYAAERYGCHVTGVSVSPEQVQYAQRRYADLPVVIRLQDYREMHGPFDRIVSIGMFEHVGSKNHRVFMESASRCLRPGGLLLLHSIATQRSWPNRYDSEVLWLTKHIFPDGLIPSLAQIGGALDGIFVTEDLHNLGSHYDPTLMAWFNNFAHGWPGLREHYGESFYRLWKHYLLSSASLRAILPRDDESMIGRNRLNDSEGVRGSYSERCAILMEWSDRLRQFSSNRMSSSRSSAVYEAFAEILETAP